MGIHLTKIKMNMQLVAIVFACVTLCLDAGYVSHKNQPKCRTEYETVTSYEQQCTYTHEQECRDVPQQRCVPKVEKLCQTLDVQECTTRYERECTNRQENKCATSERRSARHRWNKNVEQIL